MSGFCKHTIDALDMLKKLGRFLEAGFCGLLANVDACCPFCGSQAPEADTLGCMNCLNRLISINPPICRRCGRPLHNQNSKEAYCSECLTHPRFFSAARAVGIYDGFLRQAVLSLKFKSHTRLALPMAGWLKETVYKERLQCSCDLIVPVPLHPQRLYERGYNQAELLSGNLAALMGRRHAPEALSRINNSVQQSTLTAAGRAANIRGAFECLYPGIIAGRKVLLIDDVLTTGSTASECARVLLKSGCIQVTVLTVGTVPFEAPDFLCGPGL
ncbi:MAG TPA: amidophosphoribosyltransferase [Firmicutes bacterium]|jgi:ComF family protein|nr:amidophosphoribosyltransferase [Bacillota bacterium]